MTDADTLTPDEFAREVDNLGAQGLSQEEIGAHFGLTKYQVRWRLLNNGYTWRIETRVRRSGSGEKLAPAAPLAEAA
jgi:hypothetical protein